MLTPFLASAKTTSPPNNNGDFSQVLCLCHLARPETKYGATDMNLRIGLGLAVLLGLVFANTDAAQARHRHHYRHHHYQHIDRMPATGWFQTTSTYRSDNEDSRYERSTRRSYEGRESVVGGRPSGCPHAFCGCEASRYVFGVIKADLNLASNWIRKFPRTSPAPGMAAATPQHNAFKRTVARHQPVLQNLRW